MKKRWFLWIGVCGGACLLRMLYEAHGLRPWMTLIGGGVPYLDWLQRVGLSFTAAKYLCYLWVFLPHMVLAACIGLGIGRWVRALPWLPAALLGAVGYTAWSVIKGILHACTSVQSRGAGVLLDAAVLVLIQLFCFALLMLGVWAARRRGIHRPTPTRGFPAAASAEGTTERSPIHPQHRASASEQ